MICSAEQAALPPEALHDAMLDAFSDYILPVRVSFDQFRVMLKSRSFDPALSQVCVENGQVVAFWNIGRRGAASYLITSGTRPAYRGRRLSEQLGRRAIAACRAAGCPQLTTEVIIGNAPAQALYVKLGFQVQRQLDCYQLSQEANGPLPDLLEWSALRPALARLETHEASWQNQDATLEILQPKGLANTDAVAVFDPDSGTVYRLAGKVSPLLPLMRQFADLRVINLDAADRALADHLIHAGARSLPSQTELTLIPEENTP